MLIAVAQLNPTVGDLHGNTEAACLAVGEARQAGAELVILPELALLGYPPRDLLHRPGFVEASAGALMRVLEASQGTTVVLGHVLNAGKRPANLADPSSRDFGGEEILHVAVLLAEDGAIVGRQAKQHLPCYDVFDECRYFTSGRSVDVVQWKDLRVGLSVCEDLWYQSGVLEEQARAGVDLMVNVSASPYFRGKAALRRGLAARWAEQAGATLVYANMVGGQDELVFDGGSFAVRPDGEFLLSAPSFTPGVYYFDPAGPAVEPPPALDMDGTRQAIVTGLRDYVRKNSLDGVWIAVSGGVDSAVVAALAWEALGADRVSTVFMPGPFTAPESREQALSLADALGVTLLELPIEEPLETLSRTLAAHASPQGLVAENLQARVRGVLLMALCNATGRIALCPANKPEISLGYNTLYGDTVGAIAPIGDLLKGEVYELARLLNSDHRRELIPAGTLERPPSAELRAGQRDDQDLPPYEVLDPLLKALLVQNEAPESLSESFSQPVVDDVLRRLSRSEHKRRQMPLIIKVSPKAFGTGRRMPITNRYSE